MGMKHLQTHFLALSSWMPFVAVWSTAQYRIDQPPVWLVHSKLIYDVNVIIIIVIIITSFM